MNKSNTVSVLKKPIRVKGKPLFDIDTSRHAFELKDYLNNHHTKNDKPAKTTAEGPYNSSGSDTKPVKFGESGTPTWGDKPSLNS